MRDALYLSTGIDLSALIPVARDGAAIPGGLPGGRVREALSAGSDACAAARLT